MRTAGWAVLGWPPLLYGPLDDALIEARLDTVARGLGLVVVSPRHWSRRVRWPRRAQRRRPGLSQIRGNGASRGDGSPFRPRPRQ